VASLEDDPEQAVARLRPDIVGISVMSPEHAWLARTASALRRLLPEATIVVGGIHAVLYPEEVLAIPEVDLVCTGDGEEVLTAVAQAAGRPRPEVHALAGLGYRDGTGAARINVRARLVEYAPAVIEDRQVYFDRYPVLARDTSQRFISSRGCPYQCSFCYNDTLRELFRGAGNYIRRKDAANLVEEIGRVTRGHRVEAVFFMDDLFTMDKEWLRGFLALYRKEIGVPFVCTTRANILDDERAALLAGAGCRTVSYGIESGNERIRKDVLRKDVTDEAIVRCGRTLRKHGLKVQTTNMFCLPGETPGDALRTIDLNVQAGTDYAFASLLLPFPRTAIAEHCIREGYLPRDYSIKDLPESFMTRSILALPDKEIIINVQRLSYLFIRYPRIGARLRWLVRQVRLRWAYDLLFELSNFLRHKGERGISFLSAFRYAWRMRKYF